MKNLISMTDFVIEQEKEFIKPSKPFDKNKSFGLILKYAKFLKQPLELWMFVACDEDGNVLVEPETYQLFLITSTKELNKGFAYRIECENYRQAKERVLFEGFECQKQGKEYLVKFNNNPVWVNWNNSKTIEDLIPYNLTLTEPTLKQIGL